VMYPARMLQRLARQLPRRLASPIAIILCAVPCSAQIFTLGSAPTGISLAQHATDSAYDPVHDAYLVVGESQFSVQGVFVDALGRPFGPPFQVASRLVAFGPPSRPRVAYSADLDDGAGGHGGFVVVFTQYACTSVIFCVPTTETLRTQAVLYPGRTLVSATSVFSGFRGSAMPCPASHIPQRVTCFSCRPSAEASWRSLVFMRTVARVSPSN
jgi:hypothetical protein